MDWISSTNFKACSDGATQHLPQPTVPPTHPTLPEHHQLTGTQLLVPPTMEDTNHTQGLHQQDHHGHLYPQVPSNKDKEQRLATNPSLKCQATHLRQNLSTQAGTSTPTPQDHPCHRYLECTHNPPHSILPHQASTQEHLSTRPTSTHLSTTRTTPLTTTRTTAHKGTTSLAPTQHQGPLCQDQHIQAVPHSSQRRKKTQKTLTCYLTSTLLFPTESPYLSPSSNSPSP